MLWRLEYLTQLHEILQDKIGAYLLLVTFFRIDLSGLKAKWHRFLSETVVAVIYITVEKVGKWYVI